MLETYADIAIGVFVIWLKAAVGCYLLLIVVSGILSGVPGFIYAVSFGIVLAPGAASIIVPLYYLAKWVTSKLQFDN